MKFRQQKDHACIRKYLKTGDANQLAKLYEQYKRSVFERCLSLVRNVEEAEDLASETFIRTFEKLNSFRLDARFEPWLLRIAANLCIDFLRRERRFRFEVLQEEHFTEEYPENEKSSEKKVIALREELRKLKQPQRRCFCLFYINDLSYKDIADLTGFSRDQVRSHIQNARRRLRILMEQT